MKKIYLLIIIFIISIFVLTFKGSRGLPVGNQYSIDTSVTSPFESTGSTSRYALAKAIATRGSFFLTEQEAKATDPDLVYHNGKFISIFTPGVSFLTVPFYMLGDYFRFPQVFSFSFTLLVAIGNFILIGVLARRIGANLFSSIIAGITFLFATNAFSYAHTLTQHHLTVFILLLSALLAFSKRNLFTNISVGILFGVGVLVDMPNALMLIPIMLYTFFTNFKLEQIKNSLRVNINFSFLFLIAFSLLSLSVFGYYNLTTTGSYTYLAQSIGRTDYFASKEVKEKNRLKDEKSPKESKIHLPFNTREQLQGIYIMIFSNERGWLYYSPVLLLGFAGAFYAYKSKKTRPLASVFILVGGMNVILYSMFGDPWGGWAYGPRYLIPASSILAVFLGLYLSKFRKNVLLTSLFIFLFAYSLFVNTIGVYTTTQIPPKAEVETLGLKIPYTYRYNLNLINENRTSSLIYNLYLNQFLKVNLLVYVTIGLISLAVLLLVVINSTAKIKGGKNE